MSETEKPKIVLGRRLNEALLEAGIVRPEDRVRRMVIDIPHDGAVVMHVESYGDTRLLDVVPTLKGIEIREQSAEPPIVINVSGITTPETLATLKSAVESAIKTGRAR